MPDPTTTTGTGTPPAGAAPAAPPPPPPQPAQWTLVPIGNANVIGVPVGTESPEVGVQLLGDGTPRGGEPVTFNVISGNAVFPDTGRPIHVVSTSPTGEAFTRVSPRSQLPREIIVQATAQGGQKVTLRFRADPAPVVTPPRRPSMAWRYVGLALVTLIITTGLVLIATKWLERPIPPQPPVVVAPTSPGVSAVDLGPIRQEIVAAQSEAQARLEQGLASNSATDQYVATELARDAQTIARAAAREPVVRGGRGGTRYTSIVCQRAPWLGACKERAERPKRTGH